MKHFHRVLPRNTWVVVALKLKYCQITLNIAFQHFLHSVSGGKTSLSGGKNGWVVVGTDHSQPVWGEPCYHAKPSVQLPKHMHNVILLYCCYKLRWGMTGSWSNHKNVLWMSVCVPRRIWLASWTNHVLMSCMHAAVDLSQQKTTKPNQLSLTLWWIMVNHIILHSSPLHPK